MLKKIGVMVLVLVVVLVAAVFFFRNQIAQYSAEKIIRANLPGYVKIGVIKFDLSGGKLILRDFRISNPPDFSYNYLLEIEEITCAYRMKGKSILDGIEVLEPVLMKPRLTIERQGNGYLNLTEMQAVLGQDKPKSPQSAAVAEKMAPAAAALTGKRKISDIIKLPQGFLLKDGKIIFTDRFRLPRPTTITFEGVSADLSIRLDEYYSRVLGLASSGEGNINGDKSQVLKWVISYNPTTPKLTMSNRFEASGLDIVTFSPYYDKYAPLVFERGKFSGTLVFDFDNGNIGSMNEVHLSDFRFYVKKGYENAAFWGTTVPDLVKYFSTPYGEIVFDFKIKGDMQDPQFYLGPISKQAITAMAIDKIQDVVQAVSRSKNGPAPDSGSDLDKAKQYIDLIKSVIKK